MFGHCLFGREQLFALLRAVELVVRTVLPMFKRLEVFQPQAATFQVKDKQMKSLNLSKLWLLVSKGVMGTFVLHECIVKPHRVDKYLIKMTIVMSTKRALYDLFLNFIQSFNHFFLFLSFSLVFKLAKPYNIV